MAETVSSPAAGAPGAEPRATSIDRGDWVLIGALALVLAPGMRELARVWGSTEYLSHGFLIPLVSLWLWSWQRLKRHRVPVEPQSWGAVALAVALLTYAAGLLSGVVWLYGIAIVATVAAAVVWMRGTGWVRVSAFPLAFLLFMVPPPDSWITPVIVQLQVFVSVAATELLNLVGGAIVREGNILRLPSGDSLFVAEACSGVTSVITLAPLGAILAYLELKTTGARTAMMLGAVPLAMIGNLTRVVATVVIADRTGPDAAVHGPVHEILGLSVYVIGVLLLLGLGSVLRRLERRRSAAS